MKHTTHTFTLDMDGKLSLWNGEKLKRGDKKVPSGYFPSIYVMKCDKTIVYVGETSNGVVRCIKGLHNNPNESIAYRWRSNNHVRGKTIDCIVFDELHDSNKFNRARQREALEAEIAWLVKSETGEWPLLLSKINPCKITSRDATHKSLVENICKQLRTLNWLPDDQLANKSLNRDTQKARAR
jgi:hypothetical protein